MSPIPLRASLQAMHILYISTQAEGLVGLYRGFVPAVCRQCPVILVQMPLIEQIRTLAGLGHI